MITKTGTLIYTRSDKLRCQSISTRKQSWAKDQGNPTFYRDIDFDAFRVLRTSHQGCPSFWETAESCSMNDQDEERLWKPDLFSISQWRLPGDLIQARQVCHAKIWIYRTFANFFKARFFEVYATFPAGERKFSTPLADFFYTKVLVWNQQPPEVFTSSVFKIKSGSTFFQFILVRQHCLSFRLFLIALYFSSICFVNWSVSVLFDQYNLIEFK